MKTEIDYLNYDELNDIENRINALTNNIRYLYVDSIPTFNKKTWVANELPFIQEIDRIEKGVTNIGDYFFKPDGWQPTKEWITSDNLYPIKSFDYRDYNRWLNNIQLAEAQGFYQDITLWNGKSVMDWNPVKTKEEWEEI